jgi:hypothetical protein
MLQEFTLPDTWPGHEIFRTLLGHLGPSELLFATFFVCAAISCIAAVKVWQDVRRKTSSRCPWKKDATKSDGSMTRWVCSRCKAVSFTEGSEPPSICLSVDLSHSSPL